MGNAVMLTGQVKPSYAWTSHQDSIKVRPPAHPTPPVYTTDQAPTCLNKPKGRVPTKDELTTMKATVVDILPDRYNPRNGLSHQVLMVEVHDILDGPNTADRTDPISVKGQVIEVNNDMSPCIGTKADVSKGQTIFVRGKLYHNDAKGDKPDKDGIHWTHKADQPGDAGYIRVSVQGKLKTYQ
jgi:hypothetical protein